MIGGKSRFRASQRICLVSGAALLGCIGVSASAQDASDDTSGEYVASLKACQLIANDKERLVCFDRAVGSIVSANDAGEVRIIDQEDIRDTRRQLFGLSVPNVGVLERGKSEDKLTEENELFETSIASVTYLSSRKLRFTTVEGAVWEVNNLSPKLRTVEAGQTVKFKKASFGFYFARINGQLGIKSKRVQ